MFALVELLLVFVPVMAFCLWQIRLMRRDRQARERRAREAGGVRPGASGTAASP